MTDYFIDSLKPALIFKINLLHEIEQLSGERVVVEWEIDPTASPMLSVKPDECQNLFVFSHNLRRVSEFKRAGYPQVEYLPLCASKQKFSRPAGERNPRRGFECDVSFVGSLMLNNQKRLMASLLETIDAISKTEDAAWLEISKWIRNLIARPPVLTKALNVIEQLQGLLNSYKLSDLIIIKDRLYLVTAIVEEFLGYLWRKQVIEAILPFHPYLWGSREWQHDFPEYYQGYADHYLELPRVYLSSKINLDISRIYQPNIVTMRVFDVLVCGGFILADRCEALLDIFKEDWDIVCYDTPEEAVDKINYYLEHEDLRTVIARRGYFKVMNSHTFEHRINYILTRTGLHAE